MNYSAGGERILEVAARLFYAEGIGAIGVDRVVEESGVSKPTLYAQFGSKAGLIAAVLDRRREDRERTIREHLDQLPEDSGSRVLALFDWFAIGHAKPGFRGCPFTNAAAELPDPEHPARAVIAAYKIWMRETLADLAASDGLPDPQWWGSTLMLLIDGANARVITTGDTTAIVDARKSAEAMVAAAPALPLNREEAP
ncbi:DNA-binding transcriptional regulator, AcrR family [Micromonospora pallida]|uniref:DNA-binding transcriptional regulator, AcrR family n=1 Tax=Micromonospora pallida TaxID=145854 RepID=A0A1C6THC4_9ACTN|nr:TetR/AcrR family transcriptional regulator [Micromonospora pallida]SCL41057.1 DNA-binding transcriptional regulator, AcrR family [Micromonospora pallida]